MHDTAWLKDVLVYLVAAGTLIPLFHRARVGAVVGFLAVGALLGPHGLGRLAEQYPGIRLVTIDDIHRVALFGEFGVVVLLFLLGLEFSAGRLWALRRAVFGLGLLQVSSCGFAVALAAWASGLPGDVSVVVGFALAMSSTAMVVQLLAGEHRLLAPLGRTAFAVLLFQDLMVVPVLLGAEIVASHSDSVLMLVAAALAKAVAAIGVIVLAGRFFLTPLVGAAARTGARDLIMAVSLVVVALTAGLTHLAGLSAALGAFLAGMLLSGTPYQHQISVDLEPFKGLLVGLFFVSVGMSVDPVVILPHLGMLLLAAVGLVAVKVVMTYGAARLLKSERPLAGELAALLAQTGEFAFVALGLLRVGGVLSGEQAGFLVALVTLTLVMTPALAWMGGRLRRKLEQADQDAAPIVLEGLGGDHVVIGGFGRVGRIVAEALEAEGIAFVALDSDARRVRAERAAGRQIFLGDASREEMLERVVGARAAAFVVTLDSPEAAEHMVRAAQRLQPGVLVLARAKDAAHARRLSLLGVKDVIPEAVEASLSLAGVLLRRLGLSEELVSEHIEDARARELARLTGPS